MMMIEYTVLDLTRPDDFLTCCEVTRPQPHATVYHEEQDKFSAYTDQC
jgi:hypothetical protein